MFQSLLFLLSCSFEFVVLMSSTTNTFVFPFCPERIGEKNNGRIRFKSQGEVSQYKKVIHIPITIDYCMTMTEVRVVVDNPIGPPVVRLDRDMHVVTIQYRLTQPSTSTYLVTANSLPNKNCFSSEPGGSKGVGEAQEVGEGKGVGKHNPSGVGEAGGGKGVGEAGGAKEVGKADEANGVDEVGEPSGASEDDGASVDAEDGAATEVDEAGAASGVDNSDGAGGADEAGETSGVDEADGAGGADDLGGASGTDEAGGTSGVDEAGGTSGVDEADGADETGDYGEATEVIEAGQDYERIFKYAGSSKGKINNLIGP